MRTHIDYNITCGGTRRTSSLLAIAVAIVVFAIDHRTIWNQFEFRCQTHHTHTHGRHTIADALWRWSPDTSEEYAIWVINGGWKNWNLCAFIDLSRPHVNYERKIKVKKKFARDRATDQFNGFREKCGCITHTGILKSLNGKDDVIRAVPSLSSIQTPALCCVQSIRPNLFTFLFEFHRFAHITERFRCCVDSRASR